jgi:hypothetical protein
LAETVPEVGERRLLLGYYDADQNEKNKDVRSGLAESYGLTMGALRVRACRLRARLETCVRDCIGTTGRVTNSVPNVITNKEAMQT